MKIKKRYEHPTVLTLWVSPRQMVAGSISTEGQTATVELDDEEYDDTFHSRHTDNVWDEDEEEEDKALF